MSRTSLAIAAGATTAAAVALAIWIRRRTQSSGTCPLVIRAAVKDDLEHLLVVAGLKDGVGKDITGDGGDYVKEAWVEDWWTRDPRTHFNEFAFIGDLAVGFARCDCFGAPERIESGWLEGLRVHSGYQGRGIMHRLQAHLLCSLPPIVRQQTYLAVGSTNTQMVGICDGGKGRPRYEYIGAFVMHALELPKPARPADDGSCTSTLHVRILDSSEAAWSFFASHPLHTEHKPSRLLLPARFYAFRALTHAAVADKVAGGRITAICRGGTDRGNEGVLALFVNFDSDHKGWPLQTLCSFHTAYFTPGLPLEELRAVLLAFGRSRPTALHSGHPNASSDDLTPGESLTTILVAGPCDNKQPDSATDVEPKLSKVLAAAHFKRSRDTHLRVYKVP